MCVCGGEGRLETYLKTCVPQEKFGIWKKIMAGSLELNRCVWLQAVKQFKASDMVRISLLQKQPMWLQNQAQALDVASKVNVTSATLVVERKLGYFMLGPLCLWKCVWKQTMCAIITAIITHAWPMHGPACPLTKTQIWPQRANTEQNYMILLLHFIFYYNKFFNSIHAVPKDPCSNTMQLQIPPCMAQVAGHT